MFWWNKVLWCCTAARGRNGDQPWGPDRGRWHCKEMWGVMWIAYPKLYIYYGFSRNSPKFSCKCLHQPALSKKLVTGGGIDDWERISVMGQEINQEKAWERCWQHAHAKHPKGRGGERKEIWEQGECFLVFSFLLCSGKQNFMYKQTEEHHQCLSLSSFFLVNTKWKGRGWSQQYSQQCLVFFLLTAFVSGITSQFSKVWKLNLL